MICHEKRSTFLLARLHLWRAQLRWEAVNGSHVRWDAALEDTILNLDGDDKKEREREIKKYDLLLLAHRVLSLERRQERLQVKKMIEVLLSEDQSRGC